MTQFVLEVPFVTQLGFGDPANLKNDWTGCWYASACMIGHFFEAGPRFGAPQLYKPGLGNLADGTATEGHEALQPDSQDEVGFLQAEGLEKIPSPANRQWTAAGIALLLRQFGPIGFYWIKTSNGNSYGHASVIVGVIRDHIIYHDPENEPRSSMTIAQLNSTLMWELSANMIRRSGPAFQATPKVGLASVPAPKPKPNMKSNLKGGGFFGRIRNRS